MSKKEKDKILKMSKKEKDKILYGQDIQKYCQELLDKEIQALNEEDLILELDEEDLSPQQSQLPIVKPTPRAQRSSKTGSPSMKSGIYRTKRARKAYLLVGLGFVAGLVLAAVIGFIAAPIYVATVMDATNLDTAFLDAELDSGQFVDETAGSTIFDMKSLDAIEQKALRLPIVHSEVTTAISRAKRTKLRVLEIGPDEYPQFQRQFKKDFEQVIEAIKKHEPELVTTLSKEIQTATYFQ
jgi:hypothetical protein